MNITMRILVFFTTMLAVSQALSVERYVRPDGGTWEQCDGTANVAYNSSITDKSCAVKHLFELLEPQTQEVRMEGGDIINIMNNEDGSPAEYTMGAHANYTQGKCSSSWNYACVAAPIPGGTESQPTIIRGGNSNTCTTKPVLWGYGRAKQILNIDKAEHIQLSCLTLTDKSSCIKAANYPVESTVCDRSKPYDKPFADTGLLIRDANNITLTDLDIQGLSKGIHAGRLKDISLLRVNLYANSAVGWDGDIEYMGGEGNSNSGTIRFTDSSINFNGCGLIYNPGEPDHNTPHSCAKQQYNGYGDGIGTGATGGDWIFDNVKVMHNNSDGIDLLYHSLGGSIVVKNSHIEGNGGNQIKLAGNSKIINSIIIGTCAWNTRQELSLGEHGENCRALGNALSLSQTHEDTKIQLINNTIYGEGDCLMGIGNRTGVALSSQSFYAINNVFYALPDWRSGFSEPENACLYYTKSPFYYMQIHNNVVHKPKTYEDPCNTFHKNVPADGSPGLCSTSSRGSYYDNFDYTINSNPRLSDINTGVRYSTYDSDTVEIESNKPYPLEFSSPLNSSGYSGSIDGVAMPNQDYYGNSRGDDVGVGAIRYRAKTKAPVIESIISK